MTDIYKEVEEEFALLGGIDKVQAYDLAVMRRKGYMESRYTPEQALAEASSPIRQAEADLTRQALLKAQSEYDLELKRQRENNKLHDRMIQSLVNECYRRTKVMVMMRDEIIELEDDINEFLSSMGDDPAASFKLIDIKFHKPTEVMIIYSEIVRPKESE